MQSDKITPSPTVMEEYRQQMLAMSRRAAPRPPEEENWLDSRYPEPHIEQDKATMPVAEPPPIAETPFVGYLRVFATTANTAEPIEEARVTVRQGDTLYANTVTDRDGYTPVIPLPTVDPALTLQPGTVQPYVAYDIQIMAEGFRPVLHENVPIYGNNYVTQPVVLLPLLPGENADGMQDFVSGGPTNL